MYFRLMGKLNARRKGLLDENEKGFTLIELLVVVIIIGILAAIAIPVYLNVQNNAKDSAVKSDLGTAKTAVIAYQTGNGSLPASNSTSSTIDGFPGGDADKNGTAPVLTVNGDHFTIVETSKSDKTFCISDTASVIEGTAYNGGCQAAS